MAGVSCEKCSGQMQKTKKTDRSFGLQVVGLLLFFVGIFIMISMFPIGIIFGLIVMILAARMGYKRTKVWKCKNCGYFYERA